MTLASLDGTGMPYLQQSTQQNNARRYKNHHTELDMHRLNAYMVGIQVSQIRGMVPEGLYVQGLQRHLYTSEVTNTGYIANSNTARENRQNMLKEETENPLLA